MIVEPARADFRALLRNAALSISQAGYNTVVETLCCADRAVLVPFGTERETEQTDRAPVARRARPGALRGRAALSPDTLAAADRPGDARPVDPQLPAVRRQRCGARPRCLHRRAGHDRLARDRRRVRALARGRPRPVCGGATTMRSTPRRRSIACSTCIAPAKVPLALAVVPANATPALAERLARTPGVDLLQHGYAHTNHAPAARQEDGARPASAGDVRAGRARHRPAWRWSGCSATARCR